MGIQLVRQVFNSDRGRSLNRSARRGGTVDGERRNADDAGLPGFQPTPATTRRFPLSARYSSTLVRLMYVTRETCAHACCIKRSGGRASDVTRLNEARAR